MPNSDDEEETAPEVDPAYLSFYSDHVDDFKAHLAGTDGHQSLPPSYFPPNAHWTATEKDAFFHALAVHSRLRPDLIAEEVKTKSVPDVCVYLALLDQASREASHQTIYVGAEHKRKDPRIARKDLPIALEVPEDWVKQEEAMAESVAASEPILEHQSLLSERDEIIQLQRKSLRARKGEARTSSNDRDREGQRRRRREFEVWLTEAKARWTAEDHWRTLDHTSLSALDRMLREDEDGHAIPVDTLGCGGEGEDKLLGSAGPPTNSLLPFAIGEELIDPQLLEISRAPSVASSRPSPESPLVHSSLNPDDTTHSVAGPSSLHKLSFQSQPSTPPFPPTSNIAEPDSVPALPQPACTTPRSVVDNAEEELDLASMSPTSRRRCQKRLYMRRKRAQAAGVAANENATRLKPGRKPKPRPPPRKDAARAESQTIQDESFMTIDQALQGPSGAPEGAEYRHPKVSGKTRPYRRQVQFAAIGIDAQRLRQEGVGLFHLQSLGKLMQTYNQLHDVPSGVASKISLETVRLLHAIVVQFVAEVMSRSIVSREQERIAKLQTKVWHFKENLNISAANVKHALALYGADSLDKRAHFAGLLAKLGLEGDDSGDSEGEADDEHAADPTSSPDAALRSLGDAGAAYAEQDAIADLEDDDGPVLQPLPALRMIFPPFSDLSSLSAHASDERDVDTPDPAAYMPWPSSLLSTDAEPPGEDELLPETVDETALVAELLDEENIDKHDRSREVEEAKALWARFEGRKPAAPALGPTAEGAPAEAATEEKPAAPLTAGETVTRTRKRKLRPRGRSKSVAAGVEDGAGFGAEGDRGAGDGGEREGTVERRVRRRKAKGIAHLNEDQLRFMEPDPNGPIKSSVYIVDSD
ncbi:hypothetical protein BN946_scf184884.g10 [Trametes cinnabarina]|uniref:Uncharacterized protein n=1 Tax=Pycnoporus cinnabarinus TaxID=5643 RepID=A0A060S6N9_PYCCI|nr:hypothetical protein BN946_scf184884.g10 [Trametes cinnabarina]